MNNVKNGRSGREGKKKNVLVEPPPFEFGHCSSSSSSFHFPLCLFAAKGFGRPLGQIITHILVTKAEEIGERKRRSALR